jgi:hypothetical protein
MEAKRIRPCSHKTKNMSKAHGSPLKITRETSFRRALALPQTRQGGALQTSETRSRQSFSLLPPTATVQHLPLPFTLPIEAIL